MSHERNSPGVTLPVFIRPATVDVWSAIRHLHTLSIRRLADSAIEASEADAFISLIQSPDYTDTLMAHDLQTAWYEDQLVATAGWVPADDQGSSARITAAYVSPLFARLGIGRRVVAAAEGRARTAGFRAFSTRAFHSSVPFFEALGYRRSSQGVHAMGNDYGIPVVFMRRIDAVVRAEPSCAHVEAGIENEPPGALVGSCEP